MRSGGGSAWVSDSEERRKDKEEEEKLFGMLMAILAGIFANYILMCLGAWKGAFGALIYLGSNILVSGKLD